MAIGITKKFRCQFLSTSCPSCLWWGSQGRGLTFSPCKALVWVFILPLLAIFPNIHSYCPKTCIVSLCFTMHSISFILLFAAIFPGINSYILSQNMHSFTMFHHAEYEFYSPFFALFPGIHSFWLQTLFSVRTSVHKVHSEAPRRRGGSRNQTLHQEFIQVSAPSPGKLW